MAFLPAQSPRAHAKHAMSFCDDVERGVERGRVRRRRWPATLGIGLGESTVDVVALANGKTFLVIDGDRPERPRINGNIFEGSIGISLKGQYRAF